MTPEVCSSRIDGTKKGRLIQNADRCGIKKSVFHPCPSVAIFLVAVAAALSLPRFRVPHVSIGELWDSRVVLEDIPRAMTKVIEPASQRLVDFLDDRFQRIARLAWRDRFPGELSQSRPTLERCAFHRRSAGRLSIKPATLGSQQVISNVNARECETHFAEPL